jgi:hypothetical protein
MELGRDNGARRIRRRDGETTFSHASWRTGASAFSRCAETLLAGDDALYVLAGDCVARAFDRASGTERWRWGAHPQGDMLLVPAEDGERLVLIGPTRDGRMDVEIFERSDRTAALEHARVRGVGRGLSGLSVIVGDVPTRTGPDGRFAAEVDVRGRIVEVPLDGRSSEYSVAIDADFDRCE